MALDRVCSPLSGSQLFYAKIQYIENQLKQSNTPLALRDLLAQLEHLHQSLQALQAVATADPSESSEFMHAQLASYALELSSLQEKIITLFGDIHSRIMDDEVAEIKRLAEVLEDSLKEGKFTHIGNDVCLLSKQIHAFCRQNRPSQTNRQVIAHARKSLMHADKILGSTISQLNLILLNKAEFNREICIDLESEMMDLFEIADLFYHGKFKNGRQIFNALSQELKQKFHLHMELLGANPLDPEMDVHKSIQALIATAHEISNSDDGEGYLSFEEIRELFSEVDLVKGNDLASAIM